MTMSTPSEPTSTVAPGTQASPPALHLDVSQAAVDAIATQIRKRAISETSLRVGIRGGGCSGFSYVIEFHDGAPNSRDVVYDKRASDGTEVRILVDRKSLLYLNGARLEWEKTLMRQGFKFVNPNETASCGCGTSFTV